VHCTPCTSIESGIAEVPTLAIEPVRDSKTIPRDPVEGAVTNMASRVHAMERLEDLGSVLVVPKTIRTHGINLQVHTTAPFE
jgi:hypothetical protein